MRVVLYARVSSEKQVEKDLSISAQLKALRKYALERDCETYREYIDEAQSARSDKRPAFTLRRLTFDFLEEKACLIAS